MKINRYRKVHRILKFYSNNFGFRKPYQVLIDGTFCVAALKNKINIQEQICKYLEDEIKLLTTQCIIKEMEKLGSDTFGALLIIKKFGVHQCGHGKSPVSALDCILHMIGENNSSRYIIATQDRDLQEKCRKITGVPLLYLHTRTPVLEAPSVLSQIAANEKTANEFSLRQLDQEKLTLLNGDERIADIKKKRKKKGGPNPLSCMKKKRLEEKCQKKSNDNQKKRKRKRNRSKLVKKIKSELKKKKATKKYSEEKGEKEKLVVMHQEINLNESSIQKKEQKGVCYSLSSDRGLARREKITSEGFYIVHPGSVKKSHFKDVHSRKLAELLEAFHIFDFDRDGVIGHEDLRKTFASLCLEVDSEEIDQMLSEGLKPLNFDAFVILLGFKTLDLDPEEVVLDALSNWDDHHEGFISHERLKLQLMAWGDKFTEEEATEALRDAPVALNKTKEKMIDYIQFSEDLCGLRKMIQRKSSEEEN